jgi:hypothetical protein
MKQLLELEPENASHYALLSNLYAETGRWLEAEEVLTPEMGEEKGFDEGCWLES